MVERLKCDDSACEHWPHPEGDLVRFEDYEALEVNALRELAAAQTAYVARGMELRDAQARLAEVEAALQRCADYLDASATCNSDRAMASMARAALAPDSADAVCSICHGTGLHPGTYSCIFCKGTGRTTDQPSSKSGEAGK